MSRETTSLYTLPERWVSYDTTAILEQLVEARSATGVLNQLPYEICAARAAGSWLSTSCTCCNLCLKSSSLDVKDSPQAHCR